MEAEAYVGGRALPTIFNFSVNILEVITLTFPILKRINIVAIFLIHGTFFYMCRGF